MTVAYDQVVISESCRVAFPVEVLPNRGTLLPLGFQEESGRTRVEPQDIIEHSPHAAVEQPPELTEDRPKGLACPLKLPVVARDAECHLRGLDGDRHLRVEREEAQKVRVGRGVQDDLCCVSWGRTLQETGTYKTSDLRQIANIVPFAISTYVSTSTESAPSFPGCMKLTVFAWPPK